MQFSPLDIFSLQRRVDSLLVEQQSRAYQKRKRKIQIELEQFLSYLDKQIIHCTPYDICLFLASKDDKGKTAVHDVNCRAIGDRQPVCGCARRLAYGTVATKISQLKSIFESMGQKGDWNAGMGNPVCSQEISAYLNQIHIEQSIGHVVQNQAKPMFTRKLSLISMYVDRNLDHRGATPKNRYILARDQALFKLMFFGGDRGHDIGIMLTQEIRELPDKAGYIITHTYGKTARSTKPQVFSIFRCSDDMICPVKGIEQYLTVAKYHGLNLECGYLFRPVLQNNVINKPMSYEAIYDRLKFYLNKLELNEGETPHSLRNGSAITFRELGGKNLENIKQHIGWSSDWSASHYSRSSKRDQAANMVASMSQQWSIDSMKNLEAGYFEESELNKVSSE